MAYQHECSIPSSNRTRKQMAITNAFFEVCEDHELICDIAGCFDQSTIAKEEYKPGVPKYCMSHTERYSLVDCQKSRAKKNRSRSRSREFYCEEHNLMVAVAQD